MLRKLHSRQHYLVSLPVLVSLPRFSATWFWEYERCVGENREGARNGRLTCAAGKAVRRVSAILCAFICALVISLPASADSDLPNCPSDTQVTWTDCQGTYTFDNGNTYAGEWRDDKPHGQGTNTYVNGDKYVGEFRDGDFNGQGTYTWADGMVESGIWENGKRGGANISEQRRLRSLLTNAEKGDANAQYQLAERYYNGTGIHKDHSKALTWYTSAAERNHSDAQYTLALFYRHGNIVEEDPVPAMSWARKAHLNGHPEAGELYGELLLEDFVYRSDIQAIETLRETVVTCHRNIKCAFEAVWAYMDLTGDGRLSLAEIARFERMLVKYTAVQQEQPKFEVGEIAAMNIASIILLPITASSILHSFDYDDDGLLSEHEVLGDTAFAELVGIDAESLASGIDFQSLGESLQNSLELLQLLQ